MQQPIGKLKLTRDNIDAVIENLNVDPLIIKYLLDASEQIGDDVEIRIMWDWRFVDKEVADEIDLGTNPGEVLDAG